MTTSFYFAYGHVTVKKKFLQTNGERFLRPQENLELSVSHYHVKVAKLCLITVYLMHARSFGH